MNKLAILGGIPIRTKPIDRYNSIDDNEKKAALRVLDSGVLSNFYGSNCPEFYGGPEVQAFEKEWANYFNINYAVAMNSATSGLYSAIGALEISPGDEVIVSPYTMSATVSGVLVYNAIPVFADIDPDIYCLDSESIEKLITPRTKAIIVTHLFGHPADMDKIMEIARKYRLKVIEDCAQSPGASYKGKYTGTQGDIGIFSLNCHKIIQTGEGGVCITKDNELAKRLQLIRNHAEAVISQGMDIKSLVNMIGFNYRMCEIEAAIGREQLRKLKDFTEYRNKLAGHLTKRLSKIPGIIPPMLREGCNHGWYIYVVKLNPNIINISRDLFVAALRAEGFPVMSGYMKPLYNQLIYKKRILYGNQGYPFNLNYSINYHEGLCPITEKVESQILGFECIRQPLTINDMDQIADAFEKIIEQKEELKDYASRQNNNKT